MRLSVESTMKRSAWVLWLCCGLSAVASASVVTVRRDEYGWRLLVDGEPYIVKGICYMPTPVGESPDDGDQQDWMITDSDNDGRIDAPYQSWVDKNRNNKQDVDEKPVGDFHLLREMGVNTIRLYHHASANPDVQRLYDAQLATPLLYNHAPNKALLNDLFKRFGIRVAMGDLLGAYTVGSGAPWDSGTDYTDQEQLKNMLLSVEDMVREFKDEPYILLWVLGNENNYEWTHTNAKDEPAAYARYINNVARRIKQLDPSHPVCLANGEIQLLSTYARYAPDIDIFGTNVYRNPDFGNLWKSVANNYDKPILLTEYGLSHPKFVDDELDEKHQASVFVRQTCDIMRHSAEGRSPANAIGGFLYEFLDNWWQNGDPWSLNRDDKNWNNEVTGVAAQGDGEHSPFLRQLKKSYFSMKALWRGETTCP